MNGYVHMCVYIFKRIGRKETLLNSSYEARVTLIPKTEKKYKKKGSMYQHS